VASKFTHPSNAPFTKTFVIPGDAIDELGHVSNLKYVAWMQEIAIQHSAAKGWPVERYLKGGAAWVVRSHFITYLRPALEGETITLQTWVDEIKQCSCVRRYLMMRTDDQKVLVEGETNWVYVDRKSGRPLRMPEELRVAFDVSPDTAFKTEMPRTED
jgi:acyl-CoA thioester hydrolase